MLQWNSVSQGSSKELLLLMIHDGTNSAGTFIAHRCLRKK